MTNRRAHTIVLSALCGLVALGACTGTETGNPPLIDFGKTACKALDKLAKERPAESTDTTSVLIDPLYDGLTCFVWERIDAQTLRVDVTNHVTGCGSDLGWTPRLKLSDDGAVELILDDDDCTQARCGSCIYDLSFTVQLDEDMRDRPVRFYELGCEQNPTPMRATLPLSSQASGAVCTHTSGSALAQRGGHSSLRMPCGKLFNGTEATCNDGLLCTELAADQRVCLAQCQSDTDCDKLSRCDGSVCRLSATGLSFE